MQTRHVPRIGLRYWVAITFASIVGTNLGDLYAHENGLGLGLGLCLLVLLFVVAYLIEKRDIGAHEIYYWLAIVIIQTGATNIADYLAYRVRIPGLLLSAALAALIALFARGAQRGMDGGDGYLPATGLRYWAAMLSAGVFGTVVGDICAHHFGQGPASAGLGLLLAALLAAGKSRVSTQLAAYWCTVALARTAGTCMGDWLAENKVLHIGLPLSTLLTGTAFVAILALWRGASRESLGIG
jgi:uncharacterized membrane-anchored protein